MQISKVLEAHGKKPYFDGLESFFSKVEKACRRGTVSQKKSVRLWTLTPSEMDAATTYLAFRFGWMIDEAPLESPVRDAGSAVLRSLFAVQVLSKGGRPRMSKATALLRLERYAMTASTDRWEFGGAFTREAKARIRQLDRAEQTPADRVPEWLFELLK